MAALLTRLKTIDLHAPAATLHVQIADTQATRERGLMDRRRLAAHSGMLFVFDTDGLVGFWMKNTLIALDMVFVNAHGRVTSVAADVPTPPPNSSDDRIPRREGTAKYVIELGAGEAVKDGLRPGVLIPELIKT